MTPDDPATSRFRPLAAFFRLPQPLRYLLIGGYNTLMSGALYAGLYLLLGEWLHYLLILLLNYLLSVTHSFLTMKYLVFRSRGHLWQEYLRCQLSYLTLLGTNIPLLGVLVDGLGIGAIAAQLICTVVIAALGYVMHQRFSFAAR